MKPNQVPPLLAPTLLASELVFRPRTEFLGLSHIADTVSQFLDTSATFTPLEAIRLGSAKLLDRIWNSSDQFLNSDTELTDDTWLHKFLRNDRHYQQYLFAIGLGDAVTRKDLELAKWFLTKFQGLTVSSEVVAKACRAGSMEMLQLFYENDCQLLEATGVGHHVEWGGFTLSAAVEARRSDIVWWLHWHFPGANYNLSVALRSALEMGDILIAEWLILQGAGWPRRKGRPAFTMKLARQGRVDVLQWLDGRGVLGGIVGMVLGAASEGQLDTVKWLIERDSLNDGRHVDNFLLEAEIVRAIHAAAVDGHLEVAKYLREITKMDPPQTQNHLPLGLSPDLYSSDVVGGSTMTKAALNGHLDVIKWLYAEFSNHPSVELFVTRHYESYRRSFTCTAMDAAASGGHLDVLKYLHELQITIEASPRGQDRGVASTKAGPKCTELAMDGAASNGHLNVVQWLHHNRHEGCSAQAMDLAASHGHLHVVQWLHEHRQQGCTELAMDKAAEKGHLEVVKWLHANTRAGCTTWAMNEAASNGHLEIVKWLHKHHRNMLTTAAMDGAAGRGALDVVKWLHANGTGGCTTEAMDRAAEGGHLRVVEWLHKHRTEGCTTSAVASATTSNHFEVFLFLVTQLNRKCKEVPGRFPGQDDCPEINAWIREHRPVFQRYRCRRGVSGG